jgi:hypothetical protein
MHGEIFGIGEDEGKTRGDLQFYSMMWCHMIGFW